MSPLLARSELEIDGCIRSLMTHGDTCNLGSVTLFTAGIAAVSTAPDAAKAFIKFITGQDAAPVLKAKGFEPG